MPEPGEFGYQTWPKDAYRYAGGANNWGEMAVDEERGIVYVPTGSATYDFYGGDRPGMNLFANCLIALDARSGKRLWHFQTVHHDLWDLDNASAPQLTTVRRNGRRVDIVALAGKTGFLYVFDRVTGEPLWPIEERPVPKSDVPGEQAWPTQPVPTKPPPFARLSFGVEDVNPWLLSPEDYVAMRERVAQARNEGIYTPPALIDTILDPGNQGGSTGARPRPIRATASCMSSTSIRWPSSSSRTSRPGRSAADEVACRTTSAHASRAMPPTCRVSPASGHRR